MHSFHEGADGVSEKLQLEGKDHRHTWIRRFNEDGLVHGKRTLEMSVRGETIVDARSTD